MRCERAGGRVADGGRCCCNGARVVVVGGSGRVWGVGGRDMWGVAAWVPDRAALGRIEIGGLK